MVVQLIIFFFLLPSLLLSGEFTATVSRNQINLGESLTLNLILKDATTKSTPYVDVLKNAFVIHSQQQQFSTIMTKGRTTSSKTWKLTLVPQREGEIEIPSINIETSEGILTSNPVTIRVVKGSAAARPDFSHASEVTLTTEVSNATPYKNEPIIFTVKIVSKRDLADIKMQKFNLENAIVEMTGEPKIYNSIAEGKMVGVIEFNYAITPLKAGPLKIPSNTVQGMISIRRKIHNESFFDDDLDPFSFLQGFDRLKPFTLATKETAIDVQPAVAGITPWLPAKSLTIEEIWNESQALQVGEPFTRGFKITAEGINASQLPNLNELLASDSRYKIYADKPELGDNESDGKFKSSRKEQYTIIPQQAGTLTLPELSISWWDVTKKEKVLAHIPSRTLQILPAPESSLEKTPTIEDTFAIPDSPSVVVQRDPLLYALIAGLSFLLLLAVFWGIFLQKKMMQVSKPVTLKKEQTQKPEQKKKPPTTKKYEKLPDLNPT